MSLSRLSYDSFLDLALKWEENKVFEFYFLFDLFSIDLKIPKFNKYYIYSKFNIIESEFINKLKGIFKFVIYIENYIFNDEKYDFKEIISNDKSIMDKIFKYII